MPSKSGLIGQSDIWDMSDYFGGAAWETSFKWYSDARSYTSTPYTYIAEEFYRIPNYTVLNFTVKDLAPVFGNSYELTSNITQFLLKSVYINYTIPDDLYRIDSTVILFQLKSTINTYTDSVLYKVSPTVTQFLLDTTLVPVASSEKYNVSPTITTFTLS